MREAHRLLSNMWPAQAYDRVSEATDKREKQRLGIKYLQRSTNTHAHWKHFHSTSGGPRERELVRALSWNNFLGELVRLDTNYYLKKKEKPKKTNQREYLRSVIFFVFVFFTNVPLKAPEPHKVGNERSLCVRSSVCQVDCKVICRKFYC